MTPLGLLFGLAVASPTLYGALIEGNVSVDVALLRLLLIFVATTIVWTGLQNLIAGFARASATRASARIQSSVASDNPARRAADAA